MVVQSIGHREDYTDLSSYMRESERVTKVPRYRKQTTHEEDDLKRLIGDDYIKKIDGDGDVGGMWLQKFARRRYSVDALNTPVFGEVQGGLMFGSSKKLILPRSSSISNPSSTRKMPKMGKMSPRSIKKDPNENMRQRVLNKKLIENFL